MRILFLFFIPFFLSSDLVLEITRGAEKQIKLGIIQTDFTELDATEIIDVIKNDLERTGEFILIPSTEMLSIPSSPDSVIHRDWLLLDADAIIFLTTEKLEKSGYVPRSSIEALEWCVENYGL